MESKRGREKTMGQTYVQKKKEKKEKKEKK
jgi:hypothetical protein